SGVSQYIIRRLLLMIPTLLGVSLLVTAFVRLLPGDAVDILTANNEIQGRDEILKVAVAEELVKEGKDPLTAAFVDRKRIEDRFVDDQLRRDGLNPATATPAERNSALNTFALNAYKDEIRGRLGLDKNYVEQWLSWTGNALRGDLGVTLAGGRPIGPELRDRLPTSLELGVLGMAISIVIALPIGVISAVKQDSAIDYVARSSAIGMLALPSFFLATIIIALASRWFNYSCPFFFEKLWDDPAANLKLVWVPGVILGIGLSGTIMRLTRGQMLEVLRQDYMRTARSKGLAESTTVIRHGVRNAFIPIITIIGLQIPVLVGGSLVLEQIFGIPGVARYLFTAINNRDFPVIIAVNMLFAVVIIFANLVVDLTYAVLDPRIRLS
ncbi:MAG: ABC transporter permease, partial [Tepidiformaceae bacterium]